MLRLIPSGFVINGKETFVLLNLLAYKRAHAVLFAVQLNLGHKC